MNLRLNRLEAATLVALALILSYQLFVSPIVGLADNADYGRIIEKVGLRYEVVPKDPGDYIVRTFVRAERNDWSGYGSSEVLLVKGALIVDDLVSKDDRFDLRALGAVHIVVLLLGVGVLIISARPLGRSRQLVICMMVLLILGDVAYVSYFNSFYSEPASLIFLVLTVGLGFGVITLGRTSWQWLLLICAFTGAAILFVTAKPQNVVLGLPLAAFAYRLWHVPVIDHGRIPRRYIAMNLGLLLVVASILYYQIGQPASFRTANLYNMVFNEILRTSPSPEQDLHDLGLSPELGQYVGTTAYEEDVPINSIETRAALLRDVRYRDILWFYMHHPGRFFDLAQRGADDAFLIRPDYLGNFEQSSGHPPRHQSNLFNWWSYARYNLLPGSLVFLGLFLSGSAALAVIRWQRSGDRPRRRAVSELHLTLVLMAALQYFVVLLGEGEFEIVKHLFLFNVLFDISLVFLALYVLDATAHVLAGHSGRVERRSEREGWDFDQVARM